MRSILHPLRKGKCLNAPSAIGVVTVREADLSMKIVIVRVK